VDDVCPGCGAYRFRCGVIPHERLPTADAPGRVKWQQVRTPRWERIPPSQIVRPRHSQRPVNGNGNDQDEQANERVLPAVDEEDILILTALAKGRPRLLMLYDIEAEARLSRKTVSKRLKTMADAALIDWPRGPRGGVTITAAGLELLARVAR